MLRIPVGNISSCGTHTLTKQNTFENQLRLWLYGLTEVSEIHKLPLSGPKKDEKIKEVAQMTRVGTQKPNLKNRKKNEKKTPKSVRKGYLA